MEKIHIEAFINANKTQVWDFYTNPDHIVNWNFASDDWCCPWAKNDMRIGGTYIARMEAKDGSFGFDLEAIYSKLIMGESFQYGMGGREVDVVLKDMSDGTTLLTIDFDPEDQNPIEMQKNGWQSILNNFKAYAEQNA